MKTQKIIIALVIMILALNQVSAYQKLCLTKGQAVPSQEISRYVCFSDICQVCVTDTLYPTSPNRCETLTSCDKLNQTVNLSAPTITINSPINHYYYNSRSVLVNLRVNQPVDLTYSYVDDLSGKWYKLSNSKLRSFNKTIMFKEGTNTIKFRATNINGQSSDIVRKFYIDSKKPKIGRTSMDKQGGFKVDFTETNPNRLILKFSNDSYTEFSYYYFDLINDCNQTNDKYSCAVKFDLNDYLDSLKDYEGKTVYFWYELSDKAGNTDKTKMEKIFVDTTRPLVNSFNYSLSGNKLDIIFNITEKNFKDVSYYDSSDKRPRWNKLCSSLKNGICEKKINLITGNHTIQIQVNDKYENSVTRLLNVTI
jgi:hypothetical protein